MKSASTAEVVEFLRGVSPFQDLDETALNELAGYVSIEIYPKGSIVLHQDGPASEYLRVIVTGSVRVFRRSADNEEVSLGTRSEYDTFGFLSLVSGDKSRANVVATEETTCYLIAKAAVVKLLELHPPFAEYFLSSYLNLYIDKTYNEIHKASLLYGGGDRRLAATVVGDIVAREAITASPDISIKDAAEIMSRNAVSSLVLLDAGDIPVGIVTDRDLRDKVLATGRNPADSIQTVMSADLITVDAREYCFEALLRMIRYDLHHLLVLGDGKLRGVVTNHDLMILQGTSPISLAREIESQQTIDGLVLTAKKINSVIGLLMKEGARAGNITRIISELNDRLQRKILEITERSLGDPPVAYCWIIFGSEGRKEQTFKTDQDNAIIYANPSVEEDEPGIAEYFKEFASAVRDGLVRCGFPVCPADYMASNPQWCQPVRAWKKYFSTWIYTPTPDAVLKSLIFFDFRPLHGDFSLAGEVRESLNGILEGQMIFLGYMANTIIKNTPPVGFFRSFIVEKNGEHKDQLNLKIKGLALFVDMVRLFALEKGIPETSTLERIAALRSRHTILNDYADELEQAFEFIMLLRIRHQFEQIEAGLEPDNFINPNTLSNLEKKTMRNAFSLISKLQDILIERYKPLIW
ncbi:MAG: histidine kinase [Thermodesulfovibrio sp.]|nr:histidine kinase [Thermodesulfovibrio sp.]